MFYDAQKRKVLVKEDYPILRIKFFSSAKNNYIKFIVVINYLTSPVVIIIINRAVRFIACLKWLKKIGVSL